MRSPSQPEVSEPTMLNSPIVAMRPAADLRRKAAVDQIGRHVHGDEGELEAAGEEAEHQQQIGAMREGFAQALAAAIALRAVCACCRQAASPTRATAAARAACSRQRSVSVCCQPNMIHQRDRERRIKELAERARRRAEAEGASSAIAAARACRTPPARPGTSSRTRPKPISTPADRSSTGALVACAISARPSA